MLAKKRPRKIALVTEIPKIAILNGVHNPHQFSVATGLSNAKAKKLWEGKSNITLEELIVVCNTFPKVKPGDIIKRVPIS